MRAWNELEEYPRMARRYIDQEVKAQRCIPDWQAIKNNPDRVPEEYLPDIMQRASNLEGTGNIAAVNCPCRRMIERDYREILKSVYKWVDLPIML